jgi:hypothetical protein
MARYERDPRAAAGPLGKVRMRRDEHGKLVAVREPADPPRATTEAAERPPHGDDPRTAPVRNIPPFGAGV